MRKIALIGAVLGASAISIGAIANQSDQRSQLVAFESRRPDDRFTREVVVAKGVQWWRGNGKRKMARRG
jgi:hypothetical protein